MEVDCVHTGPDGLSRISRVQLPMLAKMISADGTVSWSGSQGGAGWGIASGPAMSWSDWHPVIDPLLSIVLQGAWEFEAGDGQTRRVDVGGVVIFMDRQGRGHRSRVVSHEPCATIGVRIDEKTQADFLDQIEV